MLEESESTRDPGALHLADGTLDPTAPRTLEVLWRIRDVELDCVTKGVLYALVLRSSPQNGWHCWPTHARIGRDAGVSRATVKNALRRLRAAGLVSWESRKAEQKPNLYTVHVDRLRSA